MLDDNYVTTDEMLAFVQRIVDSDHATSGMHMFSGIVDSTMLRMHEAEGEHPAGCCKYCASKEVYAAAHAVVDGDDDIERLKKAVEAVRAVSKGEPYDA